MGIMLEFGDNTTVSYRTSPSNSPAFSSSSRQKHLEQGSQTGDHPLDEIDMHKSSSLTSMVDAHEEDEGEGIAPRPVSNQEEVLLAARRAALSSVMGRWRSVVAKRQGEQNQQWAALPTVSEKPTEELTTGQHQIQQIAPPGSGGMLNSQPQSDDLGDEMGLPEQSAFNVRPSSFRNGWRFAVASVDEGLTKDDQGKGRQMPLHSERGMDLEPDEKTAKAMMRPPQSTNPPNITTQLKAETDYLKQHQVSSTTPKLALGQRKPSSETPQGNRTDVEIAEAEARYQRLLRRAARAREIYLASKVFNHWADRTARRVEREAVARRHMIRFRCFRGWSQAPPSREPESDQLRVVTAMKKWRRNLATQDDDLKANAEREAHSYKLRKADRVLDRWCCHHAEYFAREALVFHTKKKVLSSWMLQTSNTATFGETIRTHIASRIAVGALEKWKGHAEKEAIRTGAARRIGSLQQSFTQLREWWDQAEIDRRARRCRQLILLKRASFAFNQWNLQARAQAFIWRQEYLSVNRVFDRWCQKAGGDKNLQETAETVRRDRARSQFLGRLDRHEQEISRLSQLEGRASLYIGSTRLLQIFDITLNRRRVREREQVKRYLMIKYAQMSSRRKKRNFFLALDHWMAVVAQGETLREAADNLKALKNSEQRKLANETWIDQAAEDRQRHESAQVLHVRGWVVAWSDHTHDLQQRSMDAWQMWAIEEQRQHVKQWSISSLQQSGQAHTASKVRRRHDCEMRNRHLQHWKQSYERSKGNKSEPQPALVPFSRSSYRNSWGGLSARRSGFRRNNEHQDFLTSSFETPTRWTGQALPVSGIVSRSSMAPVREADEDDAASSITGAEEGAIESPARYQHRRTEQLQNLSTTTPRAPVPSHIERDFGGQYRGLLPGGGSRRTTPSLLFQTTSVESSQQDQPTRSQRSLAISERTAAGWPGGARSLRPPSTSQKLSGVAVSSSVGANSAGLLYATPQLPESTLASRSVRLRSPESFPPSTQSSRQTRGVKPASRGQQRQPTRTGR